MKGDLHVQFRENAGVKFPCVTRLSLSVKKTTTVNKINNRNKMPTAHSGTFACPNTRATASQPKEPEFLPTHRINK